MPRRSAFAPAIDLAGLAIGGGLFIVPAFAAVQAWSDADYRARTVAAVNVLNAAFMTGATVLVALLQNFGVTVPVLFLGIGVATFAVALAIRWTMPKDVMASPPRRKRRRRNASYFRIASTRSTISPATPR